MTDDEKLANLVTAMTGGCPACFTGSMKDKVYLCEACWNEFIGSDIYRQAGGMKQSIDLFLAKKRRERQEAHD